MLRLKRQKEEDRNRKSRIIEEKLLKTRVFKRAKTVMFYIALKKEVETKAMIKAARRLGKIVVVPVCKTNRISIRPCLLEDRAHLRKGPYGIWEPTLERSINPRDLDLVIVPGIAFDRKGNRVGRGKGYYDYFLKRLPKRINSIGLAFDFQILPSLPAQAHDVSVDNVVFA